MTYKEYIALADEGTLHTTFRPEEGIIIITMEINGITMRAQASADCIGVYAVTIQDDDVTDALNRLKGEVQSIERSGETIPPYITNLEGVSHD